MKRFQFSFCLLLSLLGNALQAQGHEARLEKWDALHYRFRIEISDESDQIQGKALVIVQQNTADATLQLDFFAKNEDSKGMTVTKVSEGNVALDFKHKAEVLEIKFPHSTSKTVHQIEIEYHGVPADGLIITNSNDNGKSYFGDNWPNRAHHWLPTIDHPSDKATVEFIVLAPSHYQVVANGVLKEQSAVEGNQTLHHWANEVPIPTKVMVFGAADFAVQHLGDTEGVAISSWIFKKDRDLGFYDYAIGGGILKWFVKTVAPYPWAKLANVQSRTRYGGMENASCIFYAEESVNGTRDCEALMAHEIAHQWFGNSASEANWHHIWLSEGFATYFTDLYFEQVHSQDTFVKRMEMERYQVISWVPTWKYAVVDPKITELNNLLNRNSYQKGAWILHMLRHELGDEAFMKGIRAYYEKFKLGNALTKDLQKEFEMASGQNLSTFFQQWVFRAGHPKLEVSYTWKKGKNEVEIQVKQVQEGPAFEFPLDILVKPRAGGSAVRTYMINEKQAKFSLQIDQMPDALELDPNTWLLFEGEVVAK